MNYKIEPWIKKFEIIKWTIYDGFTINSKDELVLGNKIGEEVEERSLCDFKRRGLWLYDFNKKIYPAVAELLGIKETSNW